MAQRNQSQVLIAILLSWLLITGCKKEFDSQSMKHQYNWGFNSSCGGSIIVDVPNTFDIYGGRGRHEWGVNAYTLFFNDSCQGVPIHITSAVKSFSLEVRDIQNDLYFSTTNINENWDGHKITSGIQASPGQYLWKFHLEDLDGVVHVEHGTMNIIM